MRYKIVGFLVWQGMSWYVRRRVSHIVPSRRAVAAAAVVGTVSAVAIAAAVRSSNEQQ